MDARFFDSADTFRDWLRENHESEGEIAIGFNKKGSGLGGLTIAEALDEALCYGWIDGIRRGRDSMTYTNRFTPRRAHSIWSHVNVKRVGELTALGLMQPSGLSAFARRTPERTGVYSAEQVELALDEATKAALREDLDAWAFYEQQPPTYRKAVTWWLLSAKKDETKQRRLEQLIAESAGGRRLRQFVSPKAASPTPKAGSA